MSETPEFLKPYAHGALHTLNSIAPDAGFSAGHHKPLAKGEKLGIDISGTVAMICSQFEGVMAVAFPKATYLKVVSQMLMEECSDMNAEIEEAAGEITNMVFGHSKKVLEQNGFKLEKAIPTVVRGDNHAISFKADAPVIVLPLNGAFGPAFVLVCIQKVG